MEMKLQFGDREMMTDALFSQKSITNGYNTFANECAGMPLRTDMLNILMEEHQLAHEIFTEMQKRGWYPTEEAPPEKICKVRESYQ